MSIEDFAKEYIELKTAQSVVNLSEDEKLHIFYAFVSGYNKCLQELKKEQTKFLAGFSYKETNENK